MALEDCLSAVLHARKDTLAVQGKNFFVVGHIVLMQRRAAHADARIADDSVQLAVVSNRLVHQFFNGGGLAAISLDKERIAALFPDVVYHGFALLRAAGGADNFHAVRAVALGNRAADTTAGPGDDDDFSLYAAKIHDGVLLFLINSFWINNFCCISASLVLYYQ